MRKLGISQLDPIIKEERRRIIKMSAGELGHIDVHYIAKNTVKNAPNKKLYLVGIIDSYSRVCWLEVIDSIKAINVAFAANEILLRLKQRYGIEFQEMMSDNGSEVASRNNPDHPLEKTLQFYGIKHIYTKPCTPKTNGKIERFWKTIEEDLLSGERFETIEDLRHHITGYCVYYNEHRIHQGINNKIPVMLC
jgi:transposase InsO family protein